MAPKNSKEWGINLLRMKTWQDFCIFHSELNQSTWHQFVTLCSWIADWSPILETDFQTRANPQNQTNPHIGRLSLRTKPRILGVRLWPKHRCQVSNFRQLTAVALLDLSLISSRSGPHLQNGWGAEIERFWRHTRLIAWSVPLGSGWPAWPVSAGKSPIHGEVIAGNIQVDLLVLVVKQTFLLLFLLGWSHLMFIGVWCGGNTLVEAEQPYAFLAMFLCFPTRLHLPYLCAALRKVWGRTPGAVDLGDVIWLADPHFLWEMPHIQLIYKGFWIQGSHDST